MRTPYYLPDGPKPLIDAGEVFGTAPFWIEEGIVHELGIVFHMRDLLQDVAAEQGLTRISKVVVDLGEVSGVMTDLFADAWEWTAGKSNLLRGCELEIHQIDAVTVCNDCGKTYPTVPQGRTCPHCGSLHTELLRGRELEIREIEAL